MTEASLGAVIGLAGTNATDAKKAISITKITLLVVGTGGRARHLLFSALTFYTRSFVVGAQNTVFILFTRGRAI